MVNRRRVRTLSATAGAIVVLGALLTAWPSDPSHVLLAEVREEPGGVDKGKATSTETNTSRTNSDLLRTLTKTLKRNQELQGMRFDRVAVAGASAEAVVNALVDAGMPIAFENLGDGPALQFSLSNANVDDVLREVTQRDDRYEAHKGSQGWSLLPKDSPLGRVSRRFEAHASTHVEVLRDIALQLQESLDPPVPVKYASVGSGMPQEAPASVSVDGKVYDALDQLIQIGGPWLWSIRWQIDGSVWLYLTPYPKHRIGRTTSLTVAPEE